MIAGMNRAPRQLISRRRGFSVIELLVVVGIVVILFSIFVPYVWRVREIDRRANCASNLHLIFNALTAYANDNGRNYPQTAFDPTRPAYYVAYTGAAADGSIAPPHSRPASAPATQTAPATAPSIGPSIAIAPPSTAPTTAPVAPAIVVQRPGSNDVQWNDVTASLWLLVRGGMAKPEQFICPSGDESPDPMLTGGRRMEANQRSNFTSGQHLSYSYCSPFSGYVNAKGQRFRLNTDILPADFAVMADKNPGVSTALGTNVADIPYNASEGKFAAANSRNHKAAGQNVLYVTGEVRFQKTPYCGYGATSWERDNIYTAYAANPQKPRKEDAANPPNPERQGIYSKSAGPAWEKDSFLVPTAEE
jgi:prepilin-type N-terminal cleavage/methylation domain-containing protein